MNSYFNSYLPSEAEFAFAIKIIVHALLIITVVLGVSYLFKKRGVAIVALVGLGFFGLLTLARIQPPVQIHVTQPSLISLPTPASSASTPFTSAASPSGPQPAASIQQIIGSNAPIQISEFPSWMKNPPHDGTLGAGYCKYVLTSQLYATLEEAEAELNKLLAVDVQQSCKVGQSPAVGWSPTADDLRMSGLVTEKLIETHPMKVGEFDTSVQRVSWLVEFKPASQQALLSRWQIDESQRRSKFILSALAVISGVMGVSAFALRRKPTPPRPSAAQMA